MVYQIRPQIGVTSEVTYHQLFTLCSTILVLVTIIEVRNRKNINRRKDKFEEIYTQLLSLNHTFNEWHFEQIRVQNESNDQVKFNNLEKEVKQILPIIRLYEELHFRNVISGHIHSFYQIVEYLVIMKNELIITSDQFYALTLHFETYVLPNLREISNSGISTEPNSEDYNNTRNIGVNKTQNELGITID